MRATKIAWNIPIAAALAAGAHCQAWKTADLGSLLPHAAVQFVGLPNTAHPELDCTVTCNGDFVDVDPDAKSIPKQECYGALKALCCFTGGDMAGDLVMSCDGVFTYERKAPQDRSAVDALLTHPLLRDIDDAVARDMEHHHHHGGDDWAKHGFEFSSCEGRWVYTISTGGNDGEQVALKSSDQPPRTHIFMCVGDFMSVSSMHHGTYGYAAGEDSGHGVVACKRETVAITVTGVSEHASALSAAQIERLLPRELRHTALDARLVEPRGHQGAGDGAWAEHAGLAATAGDAAMECSPGEEHPPHCNVQCDHHEGVRLWGLWPCAELDLKCSGHVHGESDVCFESELRCLGTAWPFWRTCDGTFILEQKAFVSSDEDAAESGGGAFEVATGKTRLAKHSFMYHNRKVEIGGIIASGHYSNHWCFGASNATGSSAMLRSVSEQLHSLD